jgi:MoxR-like ATPase
MKLQHLFNILSASMVGRDGEIRAMLRALIAQEHALLLGPPGTGKSYITAQLANAIGAMNDEYFRILLTRFSTPEEIFGPNRITMLKQDEYVRNVDRRMPVAKVALIDEALSLDTWIPIPGGWSTIGGIHEGDYVFGSDGKPTKVLELTPIREDADCYRVTFNDGESIVCDGGHLWNCKNSQDHSGRPWRTLKTRDMVKHTQNGKMWKLPPSSPLEHPAKELGIDPYVFGLWLGNGNCWTGELYIRSVWEDKTLAEIHKTMPGANLGRFLNGTTSARAIDMGGTGFRTWLNSNGLINNKFVPPDFITGSVEQRVRLLQGLMDTDGHLGGGSAQRTCVFSNTNESIVGAVASIARSIGLKATINFCKDDRAGLTGIKHKQCHKVTFTHPDGINVFLCREYADSVPKAKQNRTMLIKSIVPVDSVPVRCLRVEAADSLFVVGKNQVLTHNCFKASSAIINSLLTIMQERFFDNGGLTIQCPLRTLIGASNEFPEPGELDAIYDRFLVRRWVEYVPKHLRYQLLFVPMIPAVQAVTLDELDIANDEAMSLPVSEEARQTLLTIVETLETEHAIVVGDRRMVKALKIAQAEAWMDESDCVKPYHLECLTDVFWSTLDNRRKVEETVRRLSNPDELVLIEWIDYLDQLKGKRLGAGDQAEAGSAIAKLVGMLTKMNDMKQTERLGKIKDEVSDLMIHMNAILTSQSVDAHQKLRQRLAANRLAKS